MDTLPPDENDMSAQNADHDLSLSLIELAADALDLIVVIWELEDDLVCFSSRWAQRAHGVDRRTYLEAENSKLFTQGVVFRGKFIRAIFHDCRFSTLPDLGFCLMELTTKRCAINLHIRPFAALLGQPDLLLLQLGL